MDENVIVMHNNRSLNAEVNTLMNNRKSIVAEQTFPVFDSECFKAFRLEFSNRLQTTFAQDKLSVFLGLSTPTIKRYEAGIGLADRSFQYALAAIMEGYVVDDMSKRLFEGMNRNSEFKPIVCPFQFNNYVTALTATAVKFDLVPYGRVISEDEYNNRLAMRAVS